MFSFPFFFFSSVIRLTLSNSVVLELGIYVSHIVWRIRYRKLRKEAEATGKSIDDLLDLERGDTQETQHPEAGVLGHSGETENCEPTGRQSPSTADLQRSDASEKC